MKLNKSWKIFICGLTSIAVLFTGSYFIVDYINKYNANFTQGNNINPPIVNENPSNDNSGFDNDKDDIHFNKAEILQFTKYNSNGHYFNIDYFKFLIFSKFIKLNPNLNFLKLGFKVDDRYTPKKYWFLIQMTKKITI
ncbi:hypothetical protein [Spiroplasma endosymbiont of Labia minor]|uniref:hypothetical protein n=1 Tax=Spiroplasma endosymbiont of Labia minor TaxID=3066305 RepID=UPI0030D28E48